jgi:hypothetical protein
MKSYLAGLQNSVSTGYSKTQTSILGAVSQKTINSQSVVGPPLTQFIDVFTQTGLSPIMSSYSATSGTLYVLAGATPAFSVLAFSFNNVTGVYSYTGKVILNLPNVSATTHVPHAFKAYESGSSISLIIGTTGSVLANGGFFVGNGLTIADFLPGGTNLFAAFGSGQKAVYFYQDSAAYGANCVTNTVGGVTAPSSVGTRMYGQNGLAAAPAIYCWDLSITPNVTGAVVNGVTNQTTTFANTSPAAYFTMPASNGYQAVVSTAAVFEAVVLSAGTGAVPAPFVAWTTNTTQTTGGPGYFMRDLQQQFTFTTTALVSGITAGAVYSNNGINWVAPTTTASGATTVVLVSPTPWNGTTMPLASGTLNFVSGTGPASITFSAVIDGNYFFNLASTGIAAATVPTAASTNFTMYRAGGVSTNAFVFKTGSLPALAGTLLTTNSFQYALPTTVAANPALNGQSCLAVSTGTTVYLGKLSELSAGVTSWPSQVGVTLVGGISFIAPTATLTAYSSTIDKWIYVTNTSTFVVIPHQAATITGVFGGLTTTWLEGQNPPTVQFGAFALGDLNATGGWLFIVSTTAGQRGVIFMNIGSDTQFGTAAVISPVLSLPSGSIFKYIDTLEQLFDSTDSMTFSIRSAATSTDASFNSATGGWTTIHTAQDLSATAIGPFFQLQAQFDIITLDTNTPAQLNDFVYTVVPPNEVSDSWEGGGPNTTQSGSTPAYTSFRLTTAYTSIVPTMFFRAYDDNGNLVASANTASNPTFFQYTTNNGTSWNALGTIPNTVLTTEVRYLWATPPGVTVTCSFRES